MTEPIKRRPRWLRFSLRTLLVVMTVLCVWLGFKVNAARRQKEAVQAINRVGGRVTFDHEWIPIPGFPGRYSVDQSAVPPAPAWLRNLIGDEYFRVVHAVDTPSLTISESDLSALARLPSVEIVNLIYTNIIPNGDTVPRLFNDADLKALEHLTRLRELYLDETDVEGIGLKYLINVPTLKLLSLISVRVNDAGLEQIGRLSLLERLSMSGTRITDAGLRHLQGLKHLKVLSLGSSELTDGGLQHLRGLKQLTELDVGGSSQITPEGVRELQKALPNCQITGP